jgi:hypothetical protein
MSIPRPRSPYFLIKINKKDQKSLKEKHGRFYIAPTQTFMLYNKQCGEIVGIGEAAGKHFPEAKIGDILIVHHFIEGENEREARTEHLVHEDDTYNYYVVSAYEQGGKACETYGVWDGEKIIPNKDYVFLKTEKPEQKDIPDDEAINQKLKETPSGLLLFENWGETREMVEDKMTRLKAEVQSMSKSGTHKHHIMEGLQKKQAELDGLSAKINQRSFEPHVIAYANKELSEWFNREVKEGDIVFALNMAAKTKLFFMDTEYIVCRASYIAALLEEKEAA